MMRTRTVLVLCALFALTVGVTTATADGGNSDNAKLCQNGGWQNWVRADHTAFKNEGDCVSYASQGGTLTPPKTQSQLDCEFFGGTFATGTGTYLWTCNGWVTSDYATFIAEINTMYEDCKVDAAGALGWIISYTAHIPGTNLSACSAVFP